jgi:glycosyltransferase involved in cell wall biosynthesis
MTKVSIITPTHDRERFLPSICRCVEAQDYPDWEWLILDDGPSPSKDLQVAQNPRIRYTHTQRRSSIGAKRNWLVERATGDIVVHFDDDDFYHSSYVSSLVSTLHTKQLDLVNMRGWFLYDRRHQFFGYWNLQLKEGLHYVCNPDGMGLMMLDKSNNAPLENNHLGFGFGWAYRKRVWEKSPFPDRDWNEDGEFALKARELFRLDGILDTQGICLHILHAGNTSRSFPQYQLPTFLLGRLFPTVES